MANWINVSFSGLMMSSWTADETGINFKCKRYQYSDMHSAISVFSKGSFGSNGVLEACLDGKLTNLTFKGSQYPLIQEFVSYVNDIVDKNNGAVDDAVYNLTGASGRSIKVYEDKAIITVNVTIGSLLTNNATDGAKTIYYSDVIGVPFKECRATLGYLQLETASMQMNNKNSNFFGENSYTFNADQNAKMVEVCQYIRDRVEYYKKPQPVVQSVSGADELIKYKQLLDMGAITQDEFDAKKKQLLGL